MTTLHTAEDIQAYLDKQDPTVSIVTLEPEAITALLDANTSNRRLNDSRVAALRLALEHNRWKLTNDAVVTDWNGKLSNGQHRLAAAELAEKSITVLLLAGTDPATRDVIDTGQRRSLSGALTMRGEFNTGKLSAVLSLHWRYENELLRTGRQNVGVKRVALDQSLLLEHLERNPGLREALKHGENLHTRLRMFRVAPASVFYAVIMAIEPYEAAAFMTRVSNGEHLESGDPELTLRNWFQRSIGDASSDYQLGLAIKAWNKRRENEQILILGLRETESFPRAR